MSSPVDDARTLLFSLIESGAIDGDQFDSLNAGLDALQQRAERVEAELAALRARLPMLEAAAGVVYATPAEAARLAARAMRIARQFVPEQNEERRGDWEPDGDPFENARRAV